MVAGSTTPIQNVTQIRGVNVINNSALKPLTSTTFEVAMDLQFLNKRLRLDFTYYHRKTTDDIVRTDISTTSGYYSVILHVSEVSKKGIEVLLTRTALQSSNFRSNVSYNVGHNISEVVTLAPALNSIQMATTVNNCGYVNNI